MILSHRWLGRHLAELPSVDAVVRGLEQLGIEVAFTQSYGENFGMVELVEVVERLPHPDSDHLSLVQVRRGTGAITQIVTGADNGFAQQRLWYAPPGTTLPDGRTLETRDLRGIPSPGMLLSPEELGYQAHTGDLWVWEGPEPLGTTFLSAIGGVDTLYELELTPNLAQYSQSVRRIAAELAAIWNQPLISALPRFTYGDDSLAEVAATERCPLYGLVSMTLHPGQASPLWMQTLLRAVGHRIIHPAVDVTNFVLWDLGEPLHAFDARRVAGPIRVRTALPDEALTLLDGRTLVLQAADLVIADQQKPLALAGIMGGEDSGIADDTTTILLECAHFSAPGIFASSKAHNLSTDAAQHFGRGTDPETVLEAPQLVADILREAGILEAIGPSILRGQWPQIREIDLNTTRMRELLGVDWSDDKIAAALSRLDYRLDGNHVAVPLYRHDVESLYDLAEDTARFYGLDTVPRTLPVQRTQLARRDSTVQVSEDVRDLVAAAGYHEVFTRTFTNPGLESRFDAHLEGSAIPLANPLREEERQLRRTILPSLLEVVRYNRARHDVPVRIFEVGTVFSRIDGEIAEENELGVVLSLEAAAALPLREEPSVYDLTGLADLVFSRMGWDGQRVSLAEAPTWLHPGRCQRIVVDGDNVGYVGELRPRLAAEYRVRRLAVLVIRIPRGAARVSSQPGRPSRFPEVQRDLSLVVPKGVSFSALGAALKRLDLPDLREARPINQYAGDFGTSLTVRFTFQSDTATLTDETADQAIRQIVTVLAEMGVELRQ